MITAFLAAAFSLGPLTWFVPEGWESLPPPTDQHIDYIFEPIVRGGPVITVTHDRSTPGRSLLGEAKAVAQSEHEDGRTILGIAAHDTCGGALRGYDVDTRLGPLASQYYHLTVVGARLYVITYTYAPYGQRDPHVSHAIDSLCKDRLRG
jgi:hypothetical protein